MDNEGFFEKHARLRREFKQQLLRLPTVELVGIIGPSGTGVVESVDEPVFTVMQLVPWMVLGEQARLSNLRVEFPGVFDGRTEFRPGSPVRALAHVGRHSDGSTQADAVRVELWPPAALDPEIRAAVERLKEPVNFEHPSVGLMTLDRQHGWFARTVKAGRARVRVVLDSTADRPAELANETLTRVGADFVGFLDKSRQYAADCLLKLCNSTWKAPAENPITRDGFVRALTQAELHVHSDGRFSLYFEGGKLFDHHAVEVRGTPEGVFDEACISG